MTNTSQNNENSYFNLHISGIGYLGRIRTVEPKKGDAFLCCQIAALTGPSNNVEYRYFDLRVSGEEAKSLVARCEKAVNAEKKVMVGFRLGDLWVDQFVYEKGAKKGETGFSLKGRLLKINWIKIDGEMVYKSEPQAQDEQTPEDDDTPELDTSSNEVGDVDKAGEAQALAQNQLQDASITPEPASQAPQKEPVDAF